MSYSSAEKREAVRDFKVPADRAFDNDGVVYIYIYIYIRVIV